MLRHWQLDLALKHPLSYAKLSSHLKVDLFCSSTPINHLPPNVKKPMLFKELRKLFMTDQTKKILRDQKMKKAL